MYFIITNFYSSSSSLSSLHVCVYRWWINMKFQKFRMKVCKFYVFSRKMITISNLSKLCSLFCNFLLLIQVCFIHHIHYTSFTLVKRLLKFWKFATHFWIYNNFKVSCFNIVSTFWVWTISSHLFNFFYHQFFY